MRYHLAHAQYRFGLLAGERRAHDAQSAFADCIEQLKQVLEQDVKSADALALQSACYSNLAKYRRLEAVLLRSRAEDRLRTALALAPRNPRVLYLSAMDGFERSKPGTAENQRAFEQLQLAAQLFDQSSATRIDVPGWGHAETYLALGRQLQSRGDLLGARNWIEKSLIVAPDFKAAQRQMATLVRH
jgi:tetratricopeptide (TPR) repeat protein